MGTQPPQKHHSLQFWIRTGVEKRFKHQYQCWPVWRTVLLVCNAALSHQTSQHVPGVSVTESFTGVPVWPSSFFCWHLELSERDRYGNCEAPRNIVSHFALAVNESWLKTTLGSIPVAPLPFPSVSSSWPAVVGAKRKRWWHRDGSQSSLRGCDVGRCDNSRSLAAKAS